MKKVILLFVLVAAGAVLALNAEAQSTGINPTIGAVHYYKVNDVGTTYTWKLTKASDTATDLLGTVATVTSGTEGTDSLELTWVSPEVDTLYFLSVVVTDAEGCSNTKNIAIQGANNFEIYVYNAVADGTVMTGTDSLDYGACAPAITTLGWNGTLPLTDLNANDFNYDYGEIIFYYKVEASGIDFSSTSWSPAMTIAQLNGTNATVAIDTLVGGVPGSRTWTNVPAWTTGSEFQPVVPAAAGNNVLWVRVTIDNGDGTPASANENILANSYTYNLSLGDAGNSVDGNGNKTTNTQDTAPVQTQQARPDTGDIMTN